MRAIVSIFVFFFLLATILLVLAISRSKADQQNQATLIAVTSESTVVVPSPKTYKEGAMFSVTKVSDDAIPTRVVGCGNTPIVLRDRYQSARCVKKKGRWVLE